MPIPNGARIWQITAGSQTGTLTFANFVGPVTGTIFGTTPFIGFFDDASQNLTLYAGPRVAAEGGFDNVLVTPFTVYQGTLFPPFTPPGGAAPVSVLAGVFFSITGANTPVYTTWYAQSPPPIKTAKEGKDVGKDHKDHKDKEKEGKEGLVEKHPPEVLGVHAASFGPSGREPAAGPDLAVGRSFIGAGERPAVGGAALGD
jgi:hypothetical protein